MADIDKGLPNTRTEVKVPGEEVEVKEEIKDNNPLKLHPKKMVVQRLTLNQVQ